MAETYQEPLGCLRDVTGERSRLQQIRSPKRAEAIEVWKSGVRSMSDWHALNPRGMRRGNQLQRRLAGGKRYPTGD